MLVFPPLIIVVGHYGVGKTNLALNLVREQRLACQSRADVIRQTLVDLDIVNPYYRASEYTEELKTAGIDLLGPVYGTSTLDTPSLMPGIDSAIENSKITHPVLIDVGGDPDGARALARFSDQINNQSDRMVIYVVNNARPEVAKPEDAVTTLREIEEISGVKATHIAGNTHLKDQTTSEYIVASISYVKAVALAAKLPVAFITAPRSFFDEVEALKPSQTETTVLPVDIFIGNLWEELKLL